MPKKKVKLPKKVIAYLEKAGVPHKILEHKTVYTAYDAAQTLGKKLGEVAKSLLVKADKDYYVVVLPADRQVDFKKLGKCLLQARGKAVKTIKIPGEKVVRELLKLKNETVSAFGQLHKMPVVMEKELGKLKKAIFASGGFNHSVEMAVKDFLKMEGAKTGSFGVKRKK
ncbi:MAG: YbaK/EbsC family protein [Patescibacteria group bacterium]